MTDNAIPTAQQSGAAMSQALSETGLINFSVLMSVYIKEQPAFLEQALQSLQQQTLAASEIVLVEDGPITEELAEVINRYKAFLPIKSVPLAKNIGLAGALNAGLAACTYDLVARMDTDDIALPERFSVQVAFMQKHPDISASSAYLEERCDNMQRTTFIKKLPLVHDGLATFCRFRSPLSHPVVIFRKQAVQQVGGYPQIYPEDYPLWCKLIHAGYKLGNVPQVLLYMRAGDGMLSRRGRAFLPGYIQCYNLMYQLGMLSYPRLRWNILLQSAIRKSPPWLLKVLYRYGRK